MKRKQIIKRLVVGMLAVFACTRVLGGVVCASNSMTVSPPYQKMILIPGESYRNSLTVSNASGSSQALKYIVKVGSFSQGRNEDKNDDSGVISHIDKTTYNQIMDWITLDKETGTVEPGETAEVGYTIEVPENAPAGGQYASIIIADKTSEGKQSDGNISIEQTFQFASIIYAQVAGETKDEGEILENKIPSFLLNGPLTVESTVKNNGNVHTDAQYVLQVWPLFSDEEICTNEEDPETSLILPDTERYHAQSCDLPSVGIFKAKQTVKIFGETSVVERTVIMCPLWLLFVILFVIIALIIWIFMKVKKHKSPRKDEE